MFSLNSYPTFFGLMSCQRLPLVLPLSAHSVTETVNSLTFSNKTIEKHSPDCLKTQVERWELLKGGKI